MPTDRLRAAHMRSTFKPLVAAMLAASLVLLGACGDAAPPPAPPDNPSPVLATVSPAQLLVGFDPVTLRISGSGFMAASRALWNGKDRPTTYVDENTLTVSIPASDVAASGEPTVTVVNPAPGGGQSGDINVPIRYPLPIAVSISPSSAIVGSLGAPPYIVTVTGSGFTPQSVLVWDGKYELTGRGVSATSIIGLIPIDALTVASAHRISVSNPSPGGGESSAFDFSSTYSVPVIQQLGPSIATTGSAFSLIVNGTGMTRVSVVRWNGVDRSTRFDIDHLIADIPASDVAGPGTASITVYTPPPGGGSSAPASLTIRPAPLTIVGTIPVENVAIVRDSTRGVLYASVPATGGARANTIVKVDPTSATIVASLPIGSDPGLMSISDDDRYLYVALRGTPKVVRVDLQTFTKDIEFDLGSRFGTTNGYGDALATLPGLPRSVAVMVREVGVVLFDDGVARVSGTSGVGVGPRIVRGATADRLYGFNDVNTGFEFSTMIVKPDGLQVESLRTGVITGFGTRLVYDGGRVYSSNGAVVDPVEPTLLTKIYVPWSVAVAPDARNGRVHYLGSGTIQTFSTTSFAALDIYGNQALAGLSALARWGPRGIAVGGGATIVVMEGSMVAP